MEQRWRRAGISHTASRCGSRLCHFGIHLSRPWVEPMFSCQAFWEVVAFS